MNKPLTIEQLKNSEPGDWVWLTPNNEYVMLSITDKYLLAYALGGSMRERQYSDYGTKWLAYKNKEQAEAKGDYKLLRLPEENGLYVIYKNLEDSQLEYVSVSKFEAERRLAELTKE